MAYLGVPQSKLENLTTNVQIVNLGASFDGTTVTFNLQDYRGDAVFAVHERALLVVLGGITQKPGVDYTTSGSTITFTTAPVSNLTIHIRKMYGVQRIIGVNDGVISPIKLSAGGPSWNSSGNVTISGDLNVTGSFNAGTNGLFWEDNERAKFGADNDLEIYHSGVNSFIRDSGTGSLFIEGTDLTLRASSASEMRYLEANESNGDVSLFFGNNKKFETTAQGISVTGDINGVGNFILTSTNIGSTAAPEIDLFRNSTSPADADYIGQIKFTGKQDGGGTVNYAKITGKILDASNGTEDGILEFMLQKAGSNNIAARFRSDSLQLLNGTSLTVNGNISTDANINLNDSTSASVGRINLGAGDDLQIYHTGNHSRILEAGSGKLQLGSDTQVEILNGAFSVPMAQFNPGGSVVLRHNTTTRFETTTTGAKVTGALEVTQEYPTIRPTLNLNFAATKTLDHRITFTRDSLGTFTDDMGIIRYASNNVPRFDHDPTTGESLGLLIEESRANVLPYSKDEGNWTGSSAGTITTNSGIAPDGTNTASKISTTSTDLDIGPITSNVSGGNSYLSGLTGGATYTYSAYFKASTDAQVGNNFLIRMKRVSGDLVTASDNFELTSDWVRKSITFTLPANVDRIWTYVGGVIGSEALVWGAQVELGYFPTSYIPTSGSTVTRAADFATIKGTNFTDFYNQNEGTLFSEFTIKDTTYSSAAIANINQEPGASYAYSIMFVEIGTANGYFGRTYKNSSGIQISNASSVLNSLHPSTTPQKVTFGYTTVSGGELRAYWNGNYVNSSSDLSKVPTTLTNMRIGRGWNGGSDVINAHIKKLSYYNKRLPDAQLQGLTQQ